MSVRSLDGKTCLITGAGSGIGRATALRASEAGAELFLTDINNLGLEETVAMVGAAGGTVSMAKALDISDYDEVVKFGTEIHTQFSPMDVVMNIAGISAWGTIENLEHRHWKSMVDVNLMGPIHVMETFVPPMIRAGKGGHLVNVSSAAGLLALPWHAAYSASKFGLRGVSEVLRFDLKRHGIGVSLVVPGGVKTPLVGTVEIAGIDRNDPRVEKLTHRFEERAVSPEKVASCILRGIEKNTYLVYTSNDIRFGYWWARKFAPPYEFVMQKANDQFSKLLKR
ncbi:SDR family oxidoreductase [Rhodococcus erythropolis]|uniref:SDR family oxidoreductase n=1 Tax=Rhodococcus erythropolis TaxID=1833 RepID=UPI001BEAB361|nr:SDR family oxidoreductase [Rhodococcus erythropolis]MBT2266129.1 SDR family oxidoreductase [Rhodococcus erythropolis]